MTVPAAPSSDLPAYPLPRECPYHPAAGTEALREPGPVTRVRLYDGRTTWFVSGPVEARALLADRRLSNRSDFPNYPVMDPRHLRMRATREMAKEEEGGFAGALFGVDPPEHTRQRQILVPRFTVRQIATHRPEIQRIVDEQLDTMLAQGSPGDLVASFSGPVPVRVICAFLGVPYEDREYFELLIGELFEPDRADGAMVELSAYLDRLIRVAAPSAGLLGALIASHLRTGELSHAELIAFASAMLVAGTITTSSILSLGTLALLENPDQFAALHADPGLITGAVEEILRYVSVVEQLARVATEDIDIAGQVIRAGDGILISFAAANLDPEVTTHPDRLDVTRPPTNHLAFSHGIHHCIGRNLARLELDIALRTLIGRVPTLRCTVSVDQIPTTMAADVTRLVSLPVSW